MNRFALALVVLPALGLSAQAQTEVPYPTEYRQWQHVKSMLIEQGHPLYEAFGGIHHIYANPLAMEGYRSGQFPDGAVIAFDLLEAERADHAVVEGVRKVLGVMHKDQAAYPETAGWGFEGFAAGDPAARVVGANAYDACFACHTSEREYDYVFSRLRE
ncbi:cytochrome P460 family protein [Halopseudomonas phragmitis]|uniref:Cytochrome C n=1 Tax=Halopseudomonas phragmitis TaxID=1931241 RepID=A0A1V0B1M4_9GAMM|nr:cytochrome P460 family protein [Halopseudomonas phragmitis]AQZ93674.1 cytochrome C [Halopseudomonas phragmitis]